MLTITLMASPLSLFAATWDDAQGREFVVQLEELLGGETHATWVVEDLELLRELGVLNDAEFAALLEMGVAAALVHYLSPELLTEFWGLAVTDRFWLLYDQLLDSGLWMEWDSWDILRPTGLSNWNVMEGVAWDEWTWVPQFSNIWFDIGSALRLQLVDLIGIEYAMWITEDLDWERETIGETAYHEILALDLMDFLALHMTYDEIEEMLAQDDEFYIYLDLWGLLADVYDIDIGEWDDWDDYEQVHAALIELVGASHAWWIIDDLDWWFELGIIDEDSLEQFLTMDIMATLSEQLSADEMQEFLAMDYSGRYWFLTDYVFGPMIASIWADFAFVSQEDVAAVLDVIAAEFLLYDDFDLAALLALADMSFDDLVDIILFVLTIDEDATLWMAMEQGERWLYDFVDDIVWELYRVGEAGVVEFLYIFEAYMAMFMIFGDDLYEFFTLLIFEDVIDALGLDTFDEAFWGGTDFISIMQHYDTDLLDILNFRLSDALAALFDEDEVTDGLRVLDILLDGLILDNLDDLFLYFTQGPDVSEWHTQPNSDFWRFLEDWEYLIIGEDNLDQRIALDITAGTEIAIDFWDIDAGSLTLFYANHSDSGATFVIEFGGGPEEYVLEVSPGSDATMQITADQLDGGNNMVWVMIVNTDGGAVSGEFVVTKTRE